MKFFLAFYLPAAAVGFTIQSSTRPSRSFQSSTTQLQAAAVGIFFGTSTGNTEDAADMIAATFGDDSSDPIDIDEIQGTMADEFAKYDALVVGTPTWNTGAETERSGVGWDEVYYGEMQDLQLQGKKVAVFGLGDSISYAENYADGTGELHDIFSALGCTMLGFTSQDGYDDHEASKAARGENQFCGLLLDNVNYEELSEGRIQKWVSQLKEEGIVGGGTSAPVPVVAAAPVVAAPAPVVAAPANDAATDAIIAQLEKENAALRQQLDDSASAAPALTNDSSSAAANTDGYTPHHNSVTGITMWTSPDGFYCYYTSSSS
eukprot:CAMPEP_0119014672 /NCGR_PEP_ID=MMETSP1176-20130426/10175_1 /TAXON_ID=265551 /ORGANISM="Synedropsis recta cf, Strain CCMP1620" /LENGTH=318 /DNA_ID=CAMNT_0006967891 /DNA_START=124 /DNA_END=1080 /DNA_ORIENTATION=-